MGPRHRGKLISRVELFSGAGYLQKTFKGSHHTWWPFKVFNILANCEVVDK